MKIARVSVKDLFYTYTYSIDLKTDNPVSIIHAPNGYGKTTVFRLIRDTLNLNINGLFMIPFKQFCIELYDATRIVILKDGEIDDFQNMFNLIISISNDTSNSQKLVLSTDMIRHFIEDVRSPIYQKEKIRDKIINKNKEMIAEFKRIRDQIEIHFIETSRLYAQTNYDRTLCLIESEKKTSVLGRNDPTRRNPNSSIEATERIVQCAYNLRDIINQIKQSYSTESEKIDRSFPNRLVNSVNSKEGHFNEKEIQEKLEELEAKRKELKKTGFISSDSSESLPSIKDSDETLMRFYTLYIRDTFQKLNLYDNIKSKIELFLEIINERTSFSNKEMSINSAGRVIFKPKGKTTKPNSEIALEKLSSGEKHDFILFYELIFNSNAKSIFLIDEPEISLHVAWQIEYVKILEEICKLNGMQSIIATHSPDIVNNREDLLISIGLEDEQYEE